MKIWLQWQNAKWISNIFRKGVIEIFENECYALNWFNYETYKNNF